MLVLVLGASYPVLFVGWEGVGLCSYLLIGFWFTDKANADAGKKAFIVNRIGDFGFLVAMFLLFANLGTLDFVGVDARPRQAAVEGGAVVTAICLFLFLGCAGKSAQIPLYIWLPDAMAGPTPVSALIHAATMVTAGVYLIARSASLFSLAPVAQPDGRARRRADRAVRGDDRPQAVGHQEGARVLHGLAARLHVRRRGRRRVRGRRLPPDDARVLQGAAVPRLGLGDLRDAPRAITPRTTTTTRRTCATWAGCGSTCRSRSC